MALINGMAVSAEWSRQRGAEQGLPRLSTSIERMYSDPADHRDEIVQTFAKEFRKKYDAGQEEHGDLLWSDVNPARNIDHALEEVLDQAAYLYTLREQLTMVRQFLIILRNQAELEPEHNQLLTDVLAYLGEDCS